MAFVSLDQPANIDINAVAGGIRTRYPGLPLEIVPPSANGQTRSQASFLRFDGETIAFMNVAAPLPRERPIEEAWSRATRTWPQAPTVLAGHRAHLVIATVGNVASALREARLVTAVVGAALDTVAGCSAVMWAGRVVRPATSWKNDSRAAFARYPDYPILLWIDVAAIKTTSGFDAVTIGLTNFIGREIEYEVGRDTSGVLAKLAGLATYLVEHGKQVKDGHTFGASEAERIAIRDARSPRLGGAPVWRIAAGENG